jgi:hypothetical protein
MQACWNTVGLRAVDCASAAQRREPDERSAFSAASEAAETTKPRRVHELELPRGFVIGELMR